MGRRRCRIRELVAVAALVAAGCRPGQSEARLSHEAGAESRGPAPDAAALLARPGTGNPALRPPGRRSAAAAAGSQELPEGVTGAMVMEGERLFGGTGFCYTCHGAEGRGIPQLGADLTDGEWVHTDGSYEELVRLIRVGISSEDSRVGVPMPPRGGGRLSDDQVRAVAAYVWALSRRGS